MSCCLLSKSPKCVACLVLRVTFGLSVLFVGIAHYKDFGALKGMVTDGLGILTFFGGIWAVILPALMIVGGALFAVGLYMEYAIIVSGIAIGSIPVGMLIKPLLSEAMLSAVMPAATNAFIWLLVYAIVVKCVSCCRESCKGPCESGVCEKKD